MMKVVTPLCIKSPAAVAEVGDDLLVIQVTLGNHQDRPVESVRLGVHIFPQFLQDVGVTIVEYAVHRVQAEPVNVVFRYPIQRIVNKIAADLAAVVTVKVDSLPPRCRIAVGEIRPIFAKIVPFRPQVIVTTSNTTANPVP